MLAAGEPVLDCFKRENEFTRYLRVSAGADSLSASVSVTLSDQILKFLLRASKCLNRVSTRTRLAFLISSPPAGIWTAASDGRLTRVDSEATGKLLLCSSFTAPQPEKNVISKVFHLCLPCLFKLAVRAAPHAYHSGSRLHIKQTAQLRRGVRCRLLFWVERGQNGLLIATDVGYKLRVQRCASVPGLDRGGGQMRDVWASFNVMTHVHNRGRKLCSASFALHKRRVYCGHGSLCLSSDYISTRVFTREAVSFLWGRRSRKYREVNNKHSGC